MHDVDNRFMPATTAARAGKVLLALVALLATLAVPARAHGGYVVFFSDSPDRSAPRQLEGAAVGERMHAFVLPETGVAMVEFHVDDPTAQGVPDQIERIAPYDLAGGSTTRADTFDTTTLSDGFHTVTAVVTTDDGHVQTIQTGFDVGVAVGDPDAPPADQVPDATLTSGPFALLDTAPPGHSQLTGAATMARSDVGTTVTVDLAGLQPNADYLFHVHQDACSSGGGQHYQFQPGGSAYPPNEIHLAFRADADGAGSITVANPHVARPEAQSVVVHPVGVMDRIACAQLEDPKPEPDPTPEPTPDPEPDGREPIRINTGGPAQVVDGVTWQGCQDPDCNGLVTGGFAYSENDTITGVAAPANQAIYRSEWTGGQSGRGAVPVGQTAFAFAIGIDDGDWQVRLHYAELNKFAAETRVFDVDVEDGQATWNDVDLFVEAGGADRAIVHEATVTVTDGTLDLHFTRQVENAKISGIELLPVTTTQPDPDPEPTPHELRVSMRADRGGDVALDGREVNGTVRVFVPATPGIQQVRFWLDSPTSTPPRQTENLSPWDFAGGSASAGNGFDTGQLSPGAHRVTAMVTDGDGTHTVTADFTVDGDTPPPPPDPEPETPGLFSWETRASSPIVRQEAQGAAVGTRIFVFGGFHQGLQTTPRSDVYDTTTNTWRRIADMPEELTHSPVLVVDDVIWFFGGYVGDHPGGATRHVWRYDTRTDTWDRGPDLPAPRGGSGAALVGRTLHVYGGTDRKAGTTDDNDQPHHWSLSLDGGGWVRRADLPNPRNHMSGVGLGGLAYAIGGQHHENENTGNQAQVDAYDPATDTWTRVADLPTPRGHTTASAVVHQGRILVIGGTVPATGPPTT